MKIESLLFQLEEVKKQAEDFDDEGIAVQVVNLLLGSERVKFYHGKSYRSLVIIKAKSAGEVKDLIKTQCTPPHDIPGKPISKNLPKGKGADILIKLMQDSRAILEKHEINRVRVDLKENPGNMIWLWGQGANPNMPSFKGMFGLDRSGGTRDAFSSYQDYVKFLDPRIEAERSRLFNRGQNPYLGRLLEPYAGLDRDANAIEQRAGNIGALLQGSALRSTTGSQIAAVRAAREAAGGRAGLGFGGAAGALAARAASDAAVQQNATMSEALVRMHGDF